MFKQFAVKKTGFTLIEAITAITVFTAAFLSIAALITFGIKLDYNSRDTTLASNLAQEKIEEISALNYDDLGVGTLEPKSRLSTDPDSFLYNFQRETKIDYVDQNLQVIANDQGMKKITVTVYWQGPYKEKSISLATLKSKL